jgi:GDPmannose 4,6-dehydratase
MTRKAIVVGSSGQDGQLLCSQLCQRGDEVVGCVRTVPASSTSEVRHVIVDIGSQAAVSELVAAIVPNEIYFLAAFHQSATDEPGDFSELIRKSLDVNTVSLVNFLEAIRRHSAATRLFYAASSHIFGLPQSSVQDEQTPINPVSAYGISKAAGLFACRQYRASCGTFASVGILYNHESELRAAKFISRKIARGAASIKHGEAKTLTLGNLDAVVDWGYAPDYTDAMQKILQARRPDDFIVASGEPHTVRDFARIAFETVDLDFSRYVIADDAVVRRTTGALIGNPAHLIRTTGWRAGTDFPEMVRNLVKHEMASKLRNGR